MIVDGENPENCDLTKKHGEWAKQIVSKYSRINKENIEDILKEETGIVFKKVLEDCGVFKSEDAWDRFLSKI